MAIMDRYLTPYIDELIKKKMILLMGPRQVGKTTLAKSLTQNHAYYNYDIKKDLKVFKDLQWDQSKSLVIFDELHKMKNWKLWLKGICDDNYLARQKFLITGSARLDIARKMGDSLAGRYFSMRLNPLDLKELCQNKSKNSLEEDYKKLISLSGFPEPFFEGSERFYNLWKKTHSDIIVRQDLVSLEAVRDIDGIELLIEQLSTRVGSTISYNSLSEDLGRDDKTIKNWLRLLERMYIVFRVSPYSKNIARSLKKAGKYYFYDCARVEGGEAQKLENLVALSLKKEIEFQEDCNGREGDIHFIQTKEGHEIDFLIVQKKRPAHLFEVKLSDGTPSKNFRYFSDLFQKCKKIQLVRNLDREFTTREEVEVKSALNYLAVLQMT
ncbi:MAG: ATP-binding protein [Bdellovibrionia bacterium]